MQPNWPAFATGHVCAEVVARVDTESIASVARRSPIMSTLRIETGSIFNTGSGQAVGSITFQRAVHVFAIAARIAKGTITLVSVGAVFGALTGMVCLGLFLMPAIREEPLGYFFFIFWGGTFVGAPLGALGAPILGWFVLQRVPQDHILLYAPLGTLVGSFIALLFGWLFADISDGKGIFYLVVGAVIGLVVTAFVLRARYRLRRGENGVDNW